MVNHLRTAKIEIEECRTAIDGCGSWEWFTNSKYLREYKDLLNDLASQADELIIAVKQRDQYIRRQLFMDDQIRTLPQDRFEQVVEAIITSDPAMLQDLRDADAFQAIRDVSASIERYDASVLQKLIGYNELVRKVRGYATPDYFEHTLKIKSLPREVDLGSL